MAMNFAEQLKNQLNIVEVVGQYVHLKRQGGGQRWVGLCPFHPEKTPSFGVHAGHQYFKCFGCDAGGDVLNFVQQIESLTFPETLRLLAERYGIPIPERQRRDDPEAQRYAALLEIHDAAARVFEQNLNGPEGAQARRYLESRGVDANAVREFRLGLSDASGQQLVQKLKQFEEALQVDSGLIAKRQDGSGLYDRFRARLMFPIQNESGKVIAFGGRALRAGDEPKYLNSPETKLYAKSTVLYNLHRAKAVARKKDRLILVEGYMDAIGVYSAGIQEVVALCGTKLGPHQIRAIKYQVTHQQPGNGQVILNFDSDAPGMQSTEKYIATLLAEGLRVKVLEIPEKLDPDEYIQANGAEAYGKLLNDAPSYFQWLTNYARTKFDVRTAEGRVDAFRFILPAVEQVRDRVERATIASEIAEQLNVDREIVHQAIRPKNGAQALERRRQVSSAVPPNEKLLIACLLASAGARTVIRERLNGSKLIEVLELKPIFEVILAADCTSFSLQNAIAGLESSHARILTEISFAELGISEEYAAEQALDCLKLLESKSVQTKCEDLKRQIRELEIQGNLEGALSLMNELDTAKHSSRND